MASSYNNSFSSDARAPLTFITCTQGTCSERIGTSKEDRVKHCVDKHIAFFAEVFKCDLSRVAQVLSTQPGPFFNSQSKQWQTEFPVKSSISTSEVESIYTPTNDTIILPQVETFMKMVNTNLSVSVIEPTENFIKCYHEGCNGFRVDRAKLRRVEHCDSFHRESMRLLLNCVNPASVKSLLVSSIGPFYHKTGTKEGHWNLVFPKKNSDKPVSDNVIQHSVKDVLDNTTKISLDKPVSDNVIQHSVKDVLDNTTKISVVNNFNLYKNIILASFIILFASLFLINIF